MITKALKHVSIINRCVLGMQKTDICSLIIPNTQKIRSISFFSRPAKPPYNHICQVGDPVLRLVATPVDLKLSLQSPEFEKVLEQLCKVMRRYKLYGLSAPQIGVSLQVFAIEVDEKCINKVDPEVRKTLGVEPIPLTYFINPKMEVINPEEVELVECCGSLIGYEAQVRRAKEVKLKAFNRLGEPFTWQAKGWVARIAQHEFDHLKGILYVNKMDPSTFEFCYWQQLNARKGDIKVKYKL